MYSSPCSTGRRRSPWCPYILGWNVQLDTSHVIVRPPQPADTAAAYKAIGWHRDGGIAIRQTAGAAAADAPEDLLRPSATSANPAAAIPASFPAATRASAGPRIRRGAVDPDGAIEVLANPGDAVLFENRLFHAVGPNLSTITRKTVFMGYSYRWLRPLDFVTQPPELIAKVKDDPIRWQLLGAWATHMAFSLPKDEDVPLRAWCEEHGLDAGFPDMVRPAKEPP